MSSTKNRSSDLPWMDRPVAFIPESQDELINTGQTVFRTWPPPSEAEGQTETDLSWCFSGAGPEEELGTQNEYGLATKFPKGDETFLPIDERLRKVEDDQQAVVEDFRNEFEHSLDRTWESSSTRSVLFTSQ